MFHHKVVRHALAAVLPVAVAVSVVGAGTASAESDQVRFAQGLASTGEGFSTTVAPDLRTVSASLSEGRFVLGPQGVVVESAAGEQTGQIPTSFTTAGGNLISLATEIAADGHSLTVTPQPTPAATAELRTIATNPAAQFPDPVQNAAAIGAGIGLIAAAVVCIPMITTMILYLPCVGLVGLPNALVGALIGAIVGVAAPDVIPQILP
ncbi:hypothetical protein [Nocardia coubleae]|uniref:DUF8020 domain-containing protein n=1 Tax=Nocardia coubleae TaxID=356147 RepID=A0A846W6C4_9NOCA|nr:hypothetical protein [Nocardia coubleae]NKX88869.1 hypothetical protein [Nocardia coubleae]